MRAVIVLTCLVAVAVVMQATEVFSKSLKKTAPKQAVKIRDGGCPQFGALHIANRKRYTVQKCADWCNEVDGGMISEWSGAVCTGFVMSKGRSKRCYLMKDGCTQGGNKKKFEYYQFYRHVGFTLVGNNDCEGNYMSFIARSQTCHGWHIENPWADVKEFCQEMCKDNEVPDGCPKTGKICKYAIFNEAMRYCYTSEDPCKLTRGTGRSGKAGSGHVVYTMYKKTFGKDEQPATMKPVTKEPTKKREPTFYIVTNKDDPTLPKGVKCVSQQYAKQHEEWNGDLDRFLRKNFGWDQSLKLCDGILYYDSIRGGTIDISGRPYGDYDKIFTCTSCYGVLMYVEK